MMTQEKKNGGVETRILSSTVFYNDKNIISTTAALATPTTHGLRGAPGTTHGLREKRNPCFGTPPCKLLNIIVWDSTTPTPHTAFPNVLPLEMGKRPKICRIAPRKKKKNDEEEDEEEEKQPEKVVWTRNIFLLPKLPKARRAIRPNRKRNPKKPGRI
jgi:hypothetical protein